MAIGIDGLGIISYYDSTNTKIKVLRCFFLFSRPNHLFFSSFSLSNVFVVFFKSLHCDNEVCSTGTATALLTTVSSINAMHIGQYGFPFFSYNDAGTVSIFYCSNLECTKGGRYQPSLGSSGTNFHIVTGIDGAPFGVAQVASGSAGILAVHLSSPLGGYGKRY
jgi:hypothetical protein